MTRTIVMGKATDKQKEIYNIVLEAQLKVIEEANLELMNKISIIDLPSTVIHIPDLRYFDQIKTIALSKEQYERFSAYLPEKAKILFKDQSPV